MQKEYHRVILQHDTASAPEEQNGILRLGMAGSYGVHVLQVQPEEGWQGLTITATFQPRPSAPCAEALVIDGHIDVPAQATAASCAPGVITFVGTDTEGRRVAAELPYFVVSSGCVAGDAPPPAPDKWQQYIEQVDNKLVEHFAGGSPGDVWTQGAGGAPGWATPTGGGGGGAAAGINPTLLAALNGDGVSAELTADVELTDGLYAFGGGIPESTPDANKGQTLYAKIGDTGAFGKGLRLGAMPSNAGVGNQNEVATIFVKNNAMYLCGAFSANAAANRNLLFKPDGIPILKQKIALYSQTGKPVPVGAYAMLWRLG